MKYFIFIALLMFSFNNFGAEKNELLPFTSDGCSMAPDNEVIGERDWINCCVEHDKQYWLGGTLKEKETADSSFKQCLLDAGMSSVESEVYYIAVQYGGSAFLPTSWKWGYGWKNSRDYSPLTKEEKNEGRKYARLFNLPIKVATPSAFYKIFGDLTTKNYCKEDITKRLNKLTGIKNTKDFQIVKVDSEGARDAFQVFSPECKGGYFYVEFRPTLSPDRCVLNSYYSLPDQIDNISAYGECEGLLK